MTRLRFALLFTGTRLERWHLRCLDELERYADLVGTVVAPPLASPARRRESRLLQRYADRFARRSAVDIEGRVGQLPRLSLDADGRVDFVLALGPVTIPPELADAARLRVWRFQHEAGGERLPFLAEVAGGEDVSRAALVTVDGTGGGRLLEQGAFRTDKHSYAASRGRIEDAIATWPARACRRVGDEGLADLPGAPTAPVATNVRGGPVRLTALLGARRLGLAWERLFRHPQWNIGVLHRPIETLLTPGAYTGEDVDWFPLRGKAGFLADPFALQDDGRLRILAEYFDYRTSVGRISVLEHSAAGFSPARSDAFSLPTHVSYPCVVELPEGSHCVPETAAAGEIALYRASGPPGDWTRVATLVGNFPGVDPTVFRHDGRWWLMCTRQGAQEDTELWVWHADDVGGPWAPHARNPVKTDVRGARPGGPPFVHGGVLYRPAQDCSASYGGRIVLQRVLRLTPTEFAEEPVALVEGSPRSRFPYGPHTLTAVGDVVLVDGRRTVFVWAAFRAFLGIWAQAVARRLRRGG